MKKRPKKTDWLYWDVDNTLVMWKRPDGYSNSHSIFIEDPYSGWVHEVYPHLKHIQLLSMLQARGSTTVVWSAGGVEWAKAVVKALRLKPDYVLEKPATLFDDEGPETWLAGKPRWSKP